jgi:ATP-dependent Lon protease
VKIALGGVRDVADIRGHRRTFVGALPGQIIQGLKEAGTKNPVFLLDEVDDLGLSLHGDPAKALLEVLDPVKNQSFTDHYLGVPFDLSEVLFIATASFVYTLSGPLFERMEAIEFSGYTEREKAEIGKRYLWPRQLREAGMDDGNFALTDDAMAVLISEYTRESGVRQLGRQVGAVLRKLARLRASGLETPQAIDARQLREFLGRARVRPERASAEDEVGVATGMYFTPSGGDIMFVEAAVRRRRKSGGGEGDVALILTGQLGDVMRESARAALTYVINNAHELGIRERAKEVHVHAPAGAIPKDGPSAGVTIATALASALSGRPVRKEVAMSGEITLRGRVLPIGGVKQKVLGAERAGILEIILPEANRQDLEDVPAEARRNLRIHFVRSLEEVLAIALAPEPLEVFEEPGSRPSSLHA